jgi:uncharacterized membrane protein YfcA
MFDLQTLAFVLAGALVGAVSGLLGIGGAVVLVPVLVFGFGFTQLRAQGTSLAALVPPIGIFAVLQYHRQGMLDLRAAGLIGLGFVFGALGGATLVAHVPQTWLRRGFATLLVYVAAQLVFADPSRKVGAALPGAIAVGLLWAAYAVRRLLGQKPPPPRPPPPRPDTEYYI